MKSIFLNYLEEHKSLFNRLHLLDDQIIEATEILTKSVLNKKKIMLCGNGGSAADSQHIAAELTGRFINERHALPGLALSTDTSAITCISNDYSYDDIFSRQIEALGNDGDSLICISTSGNSRNIINASKTANQMGIKTIGLLGKDGGDLKPLCDYNIIVPSDVTARIQEAHILIGHAFCAGIEINLGIN